MKYITSKDAAEKWGVTERMVRLYCSEGRIQDAYLEGTVWYIPENADKPTRKKKEENNRELVEKLRIDGYNISYDKIKEANKNSYINRLHIAYALIDAGYMPTVAETYATLLKPYGKYYTPPKRLDSLDTIEFISKSGAIPVWAHPFLNMSPDEADSFLPLAKERGLIGLEALYSTYSAEEERLAFDLCKKHGILPSGGSDFHAAAKPDIEMGSGRGNLTIPFNVYKTLLTARDFNGLNR